MDGVFSDGSITFIEFFWGIQSFAAEPHKRHFETATGMAAPDYEQVVNALWNRVQTNEESLAEKRQILNECDQLLIDPNFESNPFLVSKVKLIMHKAGKPTDLSALTLEFDRHVVHCPKNVDAVICHAECLLHENKPDDAVLTLELSRQLGVQSADVLCLLSLCYRRKQVKDIAGSVALAKEAIKLDMNNGKAWASLAVAYLALTGVDNIQSSKKAFQCALKHGEDKNADVVFNYGTVSELLLDFMEALRMYEQAMLITQGWQLAVANVQRVQNRLQRVLDRAAAVARVRPKKKAAFVAKITADDEFLVMELPFDSDDVSQIAITFNRGGDILAIGYPKTSRPFFRPEKTLLKILAPAFSALEMNGASIRYCPMDPKTTQIIGGLQPKEIPGVSVTSSLV
jgi:tetratricopeptide (TPR) repeat protein